MTRVKILQSTRSRWWIGIAVVVSGLVAGSSVAQFDHDKVSMYSNVTLSQFGAGGGNDCWGWVSSSGREYALMGLNTRTGIVDITNPSSPVIIGTVSHNNSLSDIKTYQDYAYVSNGSGGGIDVIDLSDADNGNITLVMRLTDNGLQESHNIAINEDSGYLYLAVGNIEGGKIVAWDLSNPEHPVKAGTYPGDRAHDLHVITYTSGPYAGREIAFSFSEGRGIDVIDVSDKNSMFLISRTTYPGLSYCHQGWTDPGRNYLYVNDELDDIPRTSVFDISDLSNLVHLNDFNSSGTNAIDHNLYLRNGFIFEANYRSGLRIFDANSDPVNPLQVGYFDTYPANNSNGGGGAWSCWPYFPSGTVIVSDTDRGLFILDPSEAVGGSGGTEIVNLNLVTGIMIDGGIPELLESDDQYLHYRSGFGQTLVDLHNSEMRIHAITTVDSPSTVDLVIESHIDEPSGTAQILLRNFNTSQWDQVHSYAIGNSDAVESIPGNSAADYIRASDGAIRVAVKHIVFVPFLAFTFESFIDQVEITVN